MLSTAGCTAELQTKIGVLDGTDDLALRTGAFGLDGSLLTGRTLLNLDTEDWGEIFIGCAG